MKKHAERQAREAAHLCNRTMGKAQVISCAESVDGHACKDDVAEEVAAACSEASVEAEAEPSTQHRGSDGR
jgi:hypothetical protein